MRSLVFLCVLLACSCLFCEALPKGAKKSKAIEPDNIERLSGDDGNHQRVVVKKTTKTQGFKEFEEKWNANPKTDRFYKKFPQLVLLSNILASYAQEYPSQTFADLKELNGAIELMRDPTSPKHQLRGDSVKSVLRSITKSLLKRIPYENAAELIEDHLVKPCVELMKQPEVKTFFKPMVQTALTLNLNDLIKASNPHGREPRWHSIFWTSRYAFCEVFLTKMDRKRLASMVVSS